MDDPFALVGLISGLISIFTFLTGVTSLADQRSAPTNSPARPMRRVHVPRGPLTWLLWAAFAASLAVTLAAGLSGDDSMGVVFLLLVLGAVCAAVLTYTRLGERDWAIPSLVIVAGMAAAGFAMGTISRGEEAFGLLAGLAIGGGALGINHALRPLAEAGKAAGQNTSAGPGVASTGAPQSGAHETAVLKAARDRGGEITALDAALDADLSPDAAAAALASLAKRGFCVAKTEGAATIYHFADFNRGGG